MLDDLEQLRRQALEEIAQSSDSKAVQEAKAKFLGRKGRFRQVLAGLSSLPDAQKAEAGRLANQVRQELEAALKAKAGDSGAEATKRRPRTSVDLTLPGKSARLGTFHPIMQTADEIKDIFSRLGFEIAVGPEIETEHHNFEALNIPTNHPSRDAFDTFYVDETYLLRSHTSPVQVRVMESRKPPLRILAPGKVFRPDTVDASHYPMFHQVEGFMVDEDVTFGDLKGVLTFAARELFGAETRMRFRPSFFPFTEPSAEVDISCIFCGGQGCSVCSQKGWIEILGSGMIDPNVFRAVGYDPEEYTGFAFGMGIDRIAMLKYNIGDIRLFCENDVRFLTQF